MSIDIMTVLTAAVAFIMYRSSPPTMIVLFVSSVLFQSSAAIKFGGLGITPGHALIVVPFLFVMRYPVCRSAIKDSVRYPHEGFWLLFVCSYSIFSGYFFPRLFMELTLVNPIGSTMYEPSLSSVPLGPSSGNFTQSVYMAGSFVVYLIFASLASQPSYARCMLRAVSAYCALNIIFAVVDLGSYWTGIGDTLAFIHNGNYAFHVDEASVGLKRIAGAFSEAAAFATASLGLMGFTLRLWVGGVKPRLMGTLTIVQLSLLVLSTSSTGYGGIAVILSTFYIWLFWSAMRRAPTTGALTFLVLAPVLALSLVLGLRLSHDGWQSVSDVLDSVIFSKSSSDSAADRQALNAQAIVNFVDTMGWGAGAGSVRTSSFPLAVLANIGAPGALAYLMFLGMVFFRRSGTLARTEDDTIRSACRWGAFGILVASVISGALVDLGELFFVFAGAATSARPSRSDPRTSAGFHPGSAARSAHRHSPMTVQCGRTPDSSQGLPNTGEVYWKS